MYADPEIRALTAIACNCKAASLIWFENKTVQPPVFTYAIFQPPLKPEQGFQMSVSRHESLYSIRSVYVPKEVGGTDLAANLVLYNVTNKLLDCDPTTVVANISLGVEESEKCLRMLAIGVPYVHAYNTPAAPGEVARIVTERERTFDANYCGSRSDYLVIYPNRKVWKLTPLLDAYGYPRVRKVASLPCVSAHFGRPLDLSAQNLAP